MSYEIWSRMNYIADVIGHLTDLLRHEKWTRTLKSWITPTLWYRNKSHTGTQVCDFQRWKGARLSQQRCALQWKTLSFQWWMSANCSVFSIVYPLKVFSLKSTKLEVWAKEKFFLQLYNISEYLLHCNWLFYESCYLLFYYLYL